jgi:hypothetical protein
LPETQEDKDNEDEDKEPGDYDSEMPVAVVTDPISWFADVDNAMMDAKRPVDLVGWQFQGWDGKWMCEDNNTELKHPAVDYFMVAFLPNALKHILLLTNKSLQKNKGKEIG